MYRSQFTFSFAIENYIALASLPADEQTNVDKVASVLGIKSHEASYFIAEIKRHREWFAKKGAAGESCLQQASQDDLTNLYLMYWLKIISLPAYKSLVAVASGNTPGTRDRYSYLEYGKHNLRTIPRNYLERAKWTGYGGVGTAVLNEMAKIYKALGITNKSLQVCDIDTEGAKAKAIRVLKAAGFDEKIVRIAFGAAEGELTIGVGKVAAGQLIPLPPR